MEIEKFFIKLGFKPTIMDPCLYVGTFQTCVCYLLLYVDDIFLGAPDIQTIGALKQTINCRFKIKDGGPLSSNLNIKFERNRETWTFAMHQSTKITKLVSDAENPVSYSHGYPHRWTHKCLCSPVLLRRWKHIAYHTSNMLIACSI